MASALKSVFIGALIAVGAVIAVMFAYMIWIFYVVPALAGQPLGEPGEVGIDIATFARNSPWFWGVEALIFIGSSFLLYRYFSRHRRTA